MNPLRCLMTESAFLDPVNKRWIEGSLHILYDVLIHDATGHEWVDASKTPMPSGTKAIMTQVYYEKNSQIVLPLASAQFNLPANIYLNEVMNAEQDPDAPAIINPHGRNGNRIQ